MKKYLINITEAAEQDLAEIVDYIANDNPLPRLNWLRKLNRILYGLRISH